MRVSAASDVGQLRTTNQDAYCAVDLRPAWEGHAFAVADGLGGHVAGELASATALMTFLDAVRDVVEQSDRHARLTQVLVAAIRTANAAVARAGRGAGQPAQVASGGGQAGPAQVGMGTTLTAVLLNRDSLAWGHVGDSRAYLFRDGALRQLTRDHSVVAELVRQGRLSADEAAVHPQRNVLTSALGMPALAEIDSGHAELHPGDALLLCTDGLFNLVAPAELERTVADASERPDEWHALAPRLIELANRRGGPDNITLVAVLAP